ncbi:MAG: 3-methyl-2-oxobutanoate hydroxymethyltransferase [Alphaproteobacteria bacterium]
MSKSAPVRALTPSALRSRKGGEPIVCLTAYTTPTAKLMDADVDLILVGDSLGMVIYGMQSTVGVTLDMMIAHGRAVMRGTRRACVVVDLPFGSYEESAAQAFRSAARVMAETGCAAVKLEGGVEMAETIRFLAHRGVPVLGHIGLTPQSINALGGYSVRGRSPAEADAIMADAIAVAEAGAFGIVIEKTLEELSGDITRRVAVPTIGIGASAVCDGQILVTDDLVGMFPDFRPKFVKRYAELGEAYTAAVRAYAEDVRTRRFPGPDQVFKAAARK